MDVIVLIISILLSIFYKLGLYCICAVLQFGFFFFFCLTIWRYFYMSIHKYQSSFSWVHMGKTYLFAQSSDNGHIGCLLFCYGKQCDNEHTTIFMFEPMCRLNYEMQNHWISEHVHFKFMYIAKLVSKLVIIYRKELASHVGE